MPAEGSAIRSLLLPVFRRVLRIYFRDIEVVGAPPANVTGRIFAANHANGIVDPLVVITSSPCYPAPIAKSTLWKVPGLAWLLNIADAVPVLRKKDDATLAAGSNDSMFDLVAAYLAKGGNLLIFPEGVSHNDSKVLELKTGAGRMLARAKEKGTTGLTFQAVALEFDARDQFRSRALVSYGPVRSVDDVPGDAKSLAHAITDQLRDDLTELVVEGDTWGDRILIARVAEMLAHDAGDDSLGRWSEIGRQVEAARKALAAGDPFLEDVAREVGRYYAMLEAARLSDDDVIVGKEPEGWGPALSAGGLLAILPLGIAGAILYYPPYLLPRLATPLAHGERDVVSTYKLGIGLVAFPTWTIGLVIASLLLLKPILAAGAILVILTSPFAALPWLDRLDRRRGRLRTKLLGKGPSRDELTKAREDASASIARARQHLDQRRVAS